ncbi:hypothetical protein SVI_2240 [Shewanella violacea DSS12]|uniref:Uncharacterized protein n=2 Tax=Shewanella violacea TaxID=60217 RepID=D4ZKL2_SHEVD|nr:hypothetical protein SVI_2240 [Shewanella violacea DSS12]
MMSNPVITKTPPRATTTGKAVAEGVVTKEYREFNRLIWQPVTSMHVSWWQKLDLSVWQDRYQANTELGCRIDRLVAKRYGLIDRCLPSYLTELQVGLVNMRYKLEAIIIILGLLCLNEPEYFLLKKYRDALEVKLTPIQFKQAWAIWPQRPILHSIQQNKLPVDCLVEQAFGLGITLIERHWQEESIWLSLALTLPSIRLTASEKERYQLAGDINIPRWLFRLERLI